MKRTIFVLLLLIVAAVVARFSVYTVDAAEYAKQRTTESGFFVRFAEIMSTHPNLTKRVAVLGGSPRPAVASPQLGTPAPAGGL